MSYDETGLEIAVIGMAARFPGARNIHRFWDNLVQGVESIAFFTGEEMSAANVSQQALENPLLVKSNGGLLEDKERFDAVFFGYTPREAELMNPQMRIFHECAWEALEDAGCDPDTYDGLIGLYGGGNSSFYWEGEALLSGKSRELGIFAAGHLTDKDHLCTRVSYNLNLRGPALTLFTACSTSLVAIHTACQELLSGQCDMALAGGVSLTPVAGQGYLFQEGMIFSPDGHCRPFDASARGATSGEGAGVVMLKSLEDARRDNDFIYAVIKGSAINNDGRSKVGYTAPSINGQAGVIRSCFRAAEVEAESISYVEAHGTATSLGDPIEFEALVRAFDSDKKGFCGIGSVKSNFGHTDSAAGVAGFIKTVLALYHKQLPPSLHFETPNPGIDLENSPFYVVTSFTPWESNGSLRRAGVSSFGIGGTNAHVVLEEIPQREVSSTSREQQLLLLSAKTKSALDTMTANLYEYLDNCPGAGLPDVAYTLQRGRKRLEYRRAVMCSNRKDALEKLNPANAEKLPILICTEQERQVVFLFPGLGSQYVNMGRGLYDSETLFREEMDSCFGIIKKLTGLDIKAVLYPETDTAAVCLIADFETAQLVIFSFEYALARLLMGWGIVPHAMLGYSFGEYVAACVAGVFTLEEALQLVVARGTLIGQLPEGAMLSVPLPVDEVKPLLNPLLSLAIDNGPSVIVAGPETAVQDFESQMKVQKLLCMRVPASRALHSRMMEPAVDQLKTVVNTLNPSEPGIPYISNVSGDWIRAKDAVNPAYWATHLCSTVRFGEGLKKLAADEANIFVEVGPGRDISSMLSRYINEKRRPVQPVLPLIRNPQKDVKDVSYLLHKVGQLWLHGAAIDWQGFYRNERRARVPLPTYPFEGERYWLKVDKDRDTIAASPSIDNTAVQQVPPVDEWFYLPTWERSLMTPENSRSESCRWLIFSDGLGIGAALKEKLEGSGHQVTVVTPGSAFAVVEEDAYVLAPGSRADYEKLVSELQGNDRMPARILHLWGVTGKEENGLDRILDLGFYSLLHMVKALAAAESDGGFDITVVTDNMQEVTGEEDLCPAKATLIGPVLVIPQEHPSMFCRCVDIGVAEPGSLLESRIQGQLLQELLAQTADRMIAYRGNHRLVQVFKQAPLTEELELELPLREHGVYLITGGLGYIPMILERYMAEHFQCRFVLTQRSPFPDRQQWDRWLEDHSENDVTAKRIKHLQHLQSLGAETMVYSADVADLERMREVLADVEERFGPLNGVIHAAGLPEGETFQVICEMEKHLCDAQFQAKIHGMICLESLLKDKTLDFCWHMSSVSTVLGGLQFVAYSAANAYMDAFIDRHNRFSPQHWLSVDWDDTGEEETITGFRRTLALTNGTLNRIVVSDGGRLQDRIDRWVNLESFKDETNGRAGTETTFYPRPDLLTPYIAPRDETEEELSAILQRLFGFERVGVQDDFFELGGDSLRAITTISRIHKRLNVEIPLTEFFKRPTIHLLAEYIGAAETSVHTAVEAAELKEYYPLSSAQMRLFILQQMENDSVVYNEPEMKLLHGELNISRLELAFRLLIRRHDCFRTFIEIIDGEPVQRIHGDVPFELERYLDEKATAGSFMEIIDGFVRSFDLGKAPLLRAGLIKTGDTEHILMLDMHHMVTDGVSSEIFVRELGALYNGMELPPLPLQYKDYAQWQRSPAVMEAINRQEEFWLEQFTGDIPQLELPLDFERPAVQSFAGQTIEIDIDSAELDALKSLAAAEDVTLYMVLLSLFNIFLAKLGGQEDIVIGTPVAGRKHADLQYIMGIFVNTLALRNQPAAGKPFKAFLQEIKSNTLNAFDNQDYQFEDLIERLSEKIGRDMSRNPLFDVMFVLQNAQLDPVGTATASSSSVPVHIEAYPYEKKTAKFDLIVVVEEWPQQLHVKFEYSLKLFKTQTMKRFIDYFKHLVKAIATLAQDEGSGTAYVKIGAVELIPEQEKVRILDEFNRTDAPFPDNKTIHALFEEQAQRTPDRIAVSSVNPPAVAAIHESPPHATTQKAIHESLLHSTENANIQLSYRQLNEQADRQSAVLRKKGLRSGDIVPVIIHRSIQRMIAIYAILKAGAAYLPIDPDHPQERIDFMLKDSGAQVVVGTGLKVKWFNGSMVNAVDDAKEPGNLGTLQPGNQPTSPAYVIYTSGSTGLPKGVLIEHHAVVNRLDWMQQGYPIGAGDVILQKTPYTFDVSVWELFWWSWTGASLHLLAPGEEKDPEAIASAILKHHVTTMHFVPSMLNYFCDYLESGTGVTGFRSLKYVFSSGEALTPRQVQRFYRLLLGKGRVPHLVNLYGPTEATVDVSYYNCSPTETFEAATVPIGKPINNIKLYIFDPHWNIQPIGLAGELHIAGVGLARGYLNRPGLTAEKFVVGHLPLVNSDPNDQCPMTNDRLHRTGDLARWLTDGNIEYLGRIDFQVKIRGNRIELGEIENKLMEHPQVKETVVTARTGKDGEQYLCAYLVPDNSTLPGSGAWRDNLSQTLPEYMIPSYFVSMQEIPLTSSGKINRRALPDPDIEADEAVKQEYVAPRDALECSLVQIWSAVLGVVPDVIGIETNFFQLGGHSLKATILVTQIHKETDIKIPLLEIFKTPTINGLAKYIKATAKEIYTAIEPAEKRECYPVSYAQKQLFILERVGENTTAYNNTFAMHVEGELDIERLDSVLEKLIHRHEACRTSFDFIDERPMQIIHDTVEFKFQYETLPAKQGAIDVDALLVDFMKPFDLSRAPLIRISLLKLAEMKHLMLFDMHHIVTDGTSFGLLIRDFIAVYEQQELAPLSIHYKDFAVWQTSGAHKELIEEQELYWLQRLAGPFPVLDLRSDFPRPQVQSFEGKVFSILLEDDLKGALFQLMKETGSTLFMMLLAICNVLLYKYTGQEDIVIGSPVAARDRVELQPVVGMFINALVLRNFPVGDLSFVAFLEEVKENTLKDFENQSYPFGKLIETVDIPKDLSRNPAYDFELIVQNFEEPRLKTSGLTFRPHEFDARKATVDIALEVQDLGEDQFRFNFMYCTRLFKEETILQLIEHFNEVATAVVRDPDILLKDIRLSHDYTPAAVTLIQEDEASDFGF
jgi:amino acid adenylation domain-containing protein